MEPLVPYPPLAHGLLSSGRRLTWQGENGQESGRIITTSLGWVHSGVALSEREELERQVLVALGEPCGECAQVVLRMLEWVHEPEVFALVAREAGFSGPGQFSRHLRRHGFPPLKKLRDWLWFWKLVHDHQRNGRSLEQHAYGVGRDPTVLRRLVKRVTGRPWVEVRGIRMGCPPPPPGAAKGLFQLHPVRCRRGENA